MICRYLMYPVYLHFIQKIDHNYHAMCINCPYENRKKSRCDREFHKPMLEPKAVFLGAALYL